jgi:hypothetical protein
MCDVLVELAASESGIYITRGLERAERVRPALKRSSNTAPLPLGLKALAPPHECGGFHPRGFRRVLVVSLASFKCVPIKATRVAAIPMPGLSLIRADPRSFRVIRVVFCRCFSLRSFVASRLRSCCPAPSPSSLINQFIFISLACHKGLIRDSYVLVCRSKNCYLLACLLFLRTNYLL